MIFRTMILKKMKLNHNWNITMVTTEILEISLTNIVSFIQLTTTLYSTNNQFIIHSNIYEISICTRQIIKQISIKLSALMELTI